LFLFLILQNTLSPSTRAGFTTSTNVVTRLIPTALLSQPAIIG
jgi:hypothetical protein